MKWLRWGLTAVFLTLSVLYFAREVARHREALLATSWSGALAVAFAIAIAFHVFTALLDAWSWGYLLRAMGQPVPMKQAVAIFAVSQFAKYLPGNVAQHVGRVAMAKKAGWSAGRVLLSLVLENSVALGVGALLVVLGASGITLPGGARSSAALAVGVAAVAAVAAVASRHFLAHPPQLLTKRFPEIAPVTLPFRTLGVYWLVHLASYVVMALAIAALFLGRTGAVPGSPWLLPCIVALAWLAGYLVPGAPAGLGMREAVMTAGLGASTDAGVVLSVVLLWRVCSLCADAIVLGVGTRLS